MHSVSISMPGKYLDDYLKKKASVCRSGEIKSGLDDQTFSL